jgi:hypothetical protein
LRGLNKREMSKGMGKVRAKKKAPPVREGLGLWLGLWRGLSYTCGRLGSGLGFVFLAIGF